MHEKAVAKSLRYDKEELKNPRKKIFGENEIFKVREKFRREFGMVSFVLSKPKGAKIKRVGFPSSFFLRKMKTYSR